MRSLSALLLVLSAAISPVPAIDAAGYDEAVNTILCDCGCHPQTVKECACGRATEMRNEIRGMIDSGMSGEQVIAAYVAEHGEKILVAPVAAGFNLLAWLGPLFGLVAATGGLLLVARRWQRRRPAHATVSGPTLAEDAAYVERLRRDLKEMD